MKKIAVIVFLIGAFVLNDGRIARGATDPVTFTDTLGVLAVDGTGDGTVGISFVDLTPGFTFGEMVGGSFSAITSPFTAAGGTIFDFAVDNGLGTTHSISGGGATQIFSGFQGTTGSGFNVYRSLTLSWAGGVGLDVLVATTGTGAIEGLAHVPIPPSVYLMGAGLIGLVGLARRRGFSPRRDL